MAALAAEVQVVVVAAAVAGNKKLKPPGYDTGRSILLALTALLPYYDL